MAVGGEMTREKLKVIFRNGATPNEDDYAQLIDLIPDRYVVGEIEGQTVSLGGKTLFVVSDVQVDGASVVEDGAARIEYVSDLEHMSEDDKRAVRAAAVKAKFDTVNKHLEKKFEIEFVEELPTENIGKYTIYIIYDEKRESHDMWLWKNGEWIPLGSRQLEIPLASRQQDGLMSKEHFAKVEDISDIDSYFIDGLFVNN